VAKCLTSLREIVDSNPFRHSSVSKVTEELQKTKIRFSDTVEFPSSPSRQTCFEDDTA